MPRKIDNPLEDGISSKVYLLTYIYGPISGYKIARLVYGHPTYTNRIYEARDRINTAFPDAIGETEKGYVTSIKNLGRMVSECIDASLVQSSDKLTKEERDKISEVLASEGFRSFVREGAQVFIGAEEMKNVNTVQFIIDSLFDISMMHVNAELALKERKREPTLKKTRAVNHNDMEMVVDLVLKLPTSVALKIIATKPLLLEYVLNISEMLNSNL